MAYILIYYASILQQNSMVNMSTTIKSKPVYPANGHSEYS
uniref:Uncharacterized protein n=1 Tax=Arundo donax TaxID=35708 RepID=A0A0A9GVW7_ARUDO